MSNLLDAVTRGRASQWNGGDPWSDESGNGHHATLPGGTNNPTKFDHDETQAGNFFRHPGINGNRLTVPDSVALSILGDIEIRFDLSAQSYEVDKWMLGKTQGFDPEEGYYVMLDSTKKPRFGWSADGTAINTLTATAGFTGLSAGDRIHFRIRFDVDNGSSDAACTFDWRAVAAAAANDLDSDSNWTQVGDVKLFGATTSINDGNIVLQIGQEAPYGGYAPYPGKLHRVMIYSGIGGTVVLDINAASLVGDTVTQAGTFIEDSAEGATVTITQTGTAELCRLVDRPHAQYDTDDRHEIVNHADLNFDHDEPFTYGVGFRTYDTSPAADAVLVAKKADLTTGDGYGGYSESADATAKGVLGDGANTQEATSGNLTDGKAHTLIWVYDGSVTQIYLDGVASGAASADNIAADMTNALALTIGALSGGSSYAQIELWSYALIDAELTAGEVGTGTDTLHDNLLNQTLPSASAGFFGITI